jgi:hypothetical protein
MSERRLEVADVFRQHEQEFLKAYRLPFMWTGVELGWLARLEARAC